jgi:hypothetical protein
MAAKGTQTTPDAPSTRSVGSAWTLSTMRLMLLQRRVRNEPDPLAAGTPPIAAQQCNQEFRHVGLGIHRGWRRCRHRTRLRIALLGGS